MKSNDASIMIVSFDGYSDIWDIFALCINKYWPNRNYNTYLITNHRNPHYPGIEVIETGDEISWTNRLRKALTQIKSEYLIILLEDYLIDERVDDNEIDKLVEFMKNKKIDYLRLAPLPVIKGEIDEYSTILLTNKIMYGVNLQAAIWKRDYLLSVLGDEDLNAWEVEARQKADSSLKIPGNCRAATKYYIHYLNGIIQGKWYIRTINELKEKGIDVDLGARSVMTDKDMRLENIRNYILHHTPPVIVSKMKPIAKKMGFKFVTK